MRLLIVSFLLAVTGPPAAAQVFLGAEVTPDAFFKNEKLRSDTLSDDAFAWAVSAQISSAALYSVFESTAGETEILKHLRLGLYRQELIILILISEKTAVPFSKLALELDKEGGLRQLARKYHMDLPVLFSEAEDIKASADLETPLFMQTSAAAVNVSSGQAAIEISTVPVLKP